LRAAIYFTPPAGAALTRAAALWLGRDAFVGDATREPDADLDPIVAEPARYGFHATMRAPFRIAEGFDLADVDERLARFAASRQVVKLPEMALRQLGPFFALVPAVPSEGLATLEGDVLEAFDALRAPLTEAEIARRRPDRLSDRQRAQLDRWGYPHVLEDFRFHMTLTGPVEAAQTVDVAAMLQERFGAFDGAPLAVDSLAVFIEPSPGGAFRVHSLHPFGA
jgi:putative phosphonate metabolism protein